MSQNFQKQRFRSSSMGAQSIPFFWIVVGILLQFGPVHARGQSVDTEPKKATTKKDPRRANLPTQVAKIDTSMAASWSENKIKPSPVEDEVKWCRRVFLDVIGRIPSYDEFAEFAKDKSPDKKLALVNRLISEDRYTEEYANHWSSVWTNILIGRNGGMENRSLTNRAGMQKYLRDCFAPLKPSVPGLVEPVAVTSSITMSL